MSSSTEAHLGQLLVRCGHGDEVAFTCLHDRVSANLFGLVRRIVVDPAQSEEVVQQVFLELWQTSSRFDPARGSALSWMFALAHRRAVDRVRQAEAIVRRDRRHHRETLPLEYDTTSEEAMGSVDAERVRRALDLLPAGQRSALVLAYLDGYTHTEVSTILDIPLGTAKSRIRSGLLALRDLLAPAPGSPA